MTSLRRRAQDDVPAASCWSRRAGWIGIHIFHKNGWCQTISYCTYVCSFLSAWTVVSFTVERWIVVFHPLKRHRLCTPRRAIVADSSTEGAIFLGGRVGVGAGMGKYLPLPAQGKGRFLGGWVRSSGIRECRSSRTTPQT